MFAVVVAADGFADLKAEDLCAPPLLWSEVRSALHEAVWRGDVARDVAGTALERLERGPVAARSPSRLAQHAWSIADRLGWAKTYDAEYLALADLLDCPIASIDGGIHDAAARLSIARFEL